MNKTVEPVLKASVAGRSLRVAVAGTPEFARAALEAVIAAGHAVPLVLTQPDRPAGRGLKRHPSPVKQLALAHGITVCQPRSLKLDGKFAEEAQQAQAALRAAQVDVMVVAAYGLILPLWTLGMPRLGCLNIHASLLPRWRGAAPIHRAIEAGDAETGITIMQMDAGLDTGDRLLEAVERIRTDDTTATLHDRLADLGARLIVHALVALADGPLPAQPQSTEGVTYAHKIDKAESLIDWTLPAAVIERRIRAFDPFPGASTELGGEVVKVWQARVVAMPPQTSGIPPGTVLQADAQALVVACGQEALLLQVLQRPGGKRLGAREWLQGRSVSTAMRT